MHKKLSVVIPSYKDPLLQRTIDSLLENSELGDDLEIIVVLDGYWPGVLLKDDRRVTVIHLGQNVGMRGAINVGVRVCRGEYVMRTDEHCCFGKGYDRILTSTIEDNWIVTPRRFFLDSEKWEVMDQLPVDYERLKIIHYERGRKFHGIRWDRPDREGILIDESMAMQGSCWVMKKTWWEGVIGELQTEGYDTHYQDSTEMIFKTWKAGGKLMINKATWYAHKHRDFPRTHSYGGERADKCFAYALGVWGEYYETVVKPKWGL